MLRREILKASRATFWPEVNRLTPFQELYATRELSDLRTASKHSIEALAMPEMLYRVLQCDMRKRLANGTLVERYQTSSLS